MQEIVAELSAAAMAQMAGKSLEGSIGNHYRYIHRYADKLNMSVHSACLKVLSDVEKVLNFIIHNNTDGEAVGLRNEINALCRGAIVLLSIHLEAYIKEVGELAIDSLYSRGVERNSLSPKIFYHISKDLIGEFQRISDPEKIAGRIFHIGPKQEFFLMKFLLKGLIEDFPILHLKK